MRSLRFSIGGLMGLVALVAVASAALAHPSEPLAAVISLSTEGVLCLAIVGAICRTGTERVWWVGFASFGWMFQGVPLLSISTHYPTHILLTVLAPLVGVPIPANRNFGNDDPSTQAFFQIGHSLWALLAAVIGGFLAGGLFRARPSGPDATAVDAQAPSEKRRLWWAPPSAVALSVIGLLAAIAVLCSPLNPAVWTGATYLLTWWLLGLTALGACVATGRGRESWLGAAFLGVGFMLVIFNRPYIHDPREQRVNLPTVELLKAIHPRIEAALAAFSGSPNGIAASNARIQKALVQPVSMPFTEPVTLEKLIEHAEQATRSPDGSVIPIYVDPVGLKDEEKWMFSIVTGMNFEGVPLGTSLEFGLKQLNLAFVVKDGLLVITSIPSAEYLTGVPFDDPFQIVGHCLLAVIAAGLGGVAAPLACDMARRRIS